MSAGLRPAIAEQVRPAAPTRGRRRVFAALVAGLSLLWLGLAVLVFAPGGWSFWEVGLFLCAVANAPWLALAGATGLAGLLRRARHATDPAPVHADRLHLRTAIAVCVREEAMEAVIPPLSRLLDGLAAAGHGGSFALAILSDTQAPAAAIREEEEAMGLAAAHPPGAVIYRRRTDNAGYKAGNVMEFLDHQADGFSLMLLLDADSEMSPALVLRMARIMQADPGLAILQTTVAGRPARAAFGRVFGFGHLAGTLTWAAGQDWWQGDEGPFWGHNALIRIAPFRAHCRLPLLPDGSRILSHDHVEAARLHAAGWGVRVMLTPDGSTEAHPPNLPEFLSRDQRWSAGNLQYRHLLRSSDLGVLGRLQMLQALLHYALSPLWFAMLPLAALNALDGAEDTPRGLLLVLLASGYGMLHLPRLAGHAHALVRLPAGHRRAYFGQAMVESGFLLLFDSIAALDKTISVLSHALGFRRVGWPAQHRAEQPVPWGTAARRLWPHTLAGLALLGAFIASGSAFAAIVALPAVVGLIGSIPFCVLTAVPDPACDRR
jgi:membrane glycosyltransferase